MSIRAIAVAILSIFAFSVLPNVSAQDAVTPATDSKTAVAYAHAAENDPLSQTASLQRKEAMSYVENDHQTHVVLCQRLFQEMSGDRAANGHEVILQYMISAAAFVYEHPDAVADSKAQNLAGVQSALNVYEKFLAADPKSRFKFLDGLAKDRAKGDLEKQLTTLCK